MRNIFISLLGGVALSVLASGCAGPEQKLGRGLSNSLEPVRLGEMGRSIEQANLFDSPNTGYATGLVRGIDRTLARTGLGIWEIVTFPFPNHEKSYAPIASSYLSSNPVYPESYTPNWLGGDTTMETDVALGMSGGDVAPFVPGSRFHIFDN